MACTIGGSAVAGGDYVAFPDSVTIADGEPTATVTVTPLANSASGARTVILTLVPGAFVTTTEQSDTVSIQDVWQFTPGETNVWMGTGNWTNVAGWSLSRVPVAGDFVVISNSITVTSAPPALAALTVYSNVTVQGWDTPLAALEMSLMRGVMTHGANTATNAPWTPDNRITLIASNLTLAAAATINVDNRGYSGGIYNVQTAGYGPGRGTSSRMGGGHGGAGGTQTTPAAGGVTNGLVDAPVNPGSGGAREQFATDTTSPGAGAGGGAIRIAAAGTVVINGTVTANGQSANGYGGNAGGSGGSIFITCNTFAATNGILRANGGNDSNAGGAGGGGRIAVIYDTTAQDAMPPVLLAELSVNTARLGTVRRGMIGTLYAPDHRLLPIAPSNNGFNGVIQGISAWSPSSLALQGGWVQTTVAALDVGGNMTLNGTQLDLLQRPDLATLVVTVGGDLLLTNSAAHLHIYAGVTNALTPAYGALLDVTGTLTLAGSNTIIYPYSMNTNGGSVKIKAASVEVRTNASINANALGYLGRLGTGYGLGGGNYSGGGGYGGKGGKASGSWGQDYGVSNAPAMPGSAGASQDSVGNRGGNGGGLVWIESASSINVSGSLTANGGTAGTWGGDGGGSGGGIFLTAQTFSGSGTMTASGSNGNSSGGGGGGGRIALLFGMTDGFLGSLSANFGTGSSGSANGATGTVVRLLSGVAHLLTVQGHPAGYGTPTPLNYGVHGITENDWVTNSVATPANTVGGQRWSCLGYTLSNATTVVASGTSTQAVFQMTEPLWLVWRWTNEFYLTASANVNGSLQVDKTGWYTNGTEVSLTAVPAGGHHFLQWSGSGVPVAQRLETTLNLTMDQARTVQANFASDTPATRTWSGSGSWLAAANWSPAGVPGTADALTVSTGTLIIDELLRVQSFTATNATVEFRNWETRLETSEDVHLRNGTTVTLPSAGFADGEMSNRVHVVARNFTLDSGATINGATRGYRGVTRALDPAPRSTGYGPGKGTATRGAGHGTQGGNSGGPEYGEADNPLYPGSSGGAESGDPSLDGQSGAGGGAVLVEASGILTLNGIINMNGGSFSVWSGNAGGSGGSVNLFCRRIAGTTGTISASGGNGGVNGGGGAGGRVAASFQYDVTTGAIEAGINVNGGSGGKGNGGSGSIHWFQRPPTGTLIQVR